MNLAEMAIIAVIDERLSGKYGDLTKQLLGGRDPYTDGNLRREATDKVNLMTNFELLELVTPLLASKLQEIGKSGQS